MNHAEKARELFVEGYNCSQAVFGAFCDVTGMDFETAMKLSSSFGGGMGRMREVCGACSAMFMVAGMIDGYSDPKDNKVKGDHYALIQSLAEKFKEQNSGTIICRELIKTLKCTSTPQPTVRTPEFYKVRPCVKFVEDAARIIDQYIDEKEAENN